jgi:hypothetical protein
MIRRMLSGFIGAILGYVCGAILGYFLVEGLSSNMHDRSVEAAMTGAFVVGPLAAVIAFITGFVFGGRKTTGNPDEKT